MGQIAKLPFHGLVGFENQQTEACPRPGARIAFVVSNFHRDLTSAMLESAREELAASGVPESDTEVAWVPGSFELPLVARRFARRDDVDGVICIGLVLKGQTTHDVYVAQGATHLPAADWQAQVIQDGLLVTGQNPASAKGVAEALVAALR